MKIAIEKNSIRDITEQKREEETMYFLRETLLLIVTISYSVILSFSMIDRRPYKRILAMVMLGIYCSFLTILLVTMIQGLTHYDLFPQTLVALIFAPLVEEVMKFFTIFFLGLLLQGIISKFEMIRLGGAVGLGFGSLETLGYIIKGIDLSTTIKRFLATSPFHISSSFLISTSLTERKYWLLPLAILFHSLSNYLASLNFLLQATLALSLFLFLYYFSENDYSQIKEASRTLRSAFSIRHKKGVVGG